VEEGSIIQEPSQRVFKIPKNSPGTTEESSGSVPVSKRAKKFGDCYNATPSFLKKASGLDPQLEGNFINHSTDDNIDNQTHTIKNACL
jgi:hypothetical protein